MANTFKTRRTIKFRDGDPAQIMYFANLFSFSHDAFEEFIVAAGYKYREWFTLTGEYMVPIRHTDANYLAPFMMGETYDIEVSVAQIRETSFQMKYVFGQNGKTYGIVTMVHAFMSAKTRQKAPVPQQVIDRLTPYLENP